MVKQQERIRIAVDDSIVTITINGGGEDLMFRAELPVRGLNEHVPPGLSHLGLATLDTVEAPREYVISLEFDVESRDDTVFRRRSLRKLDAHVRDVTLKLRDDGYVVEGDLLRWVGYTAAYVDEAARADAPRREDI